MKNRLISYLVRIYLVFVISSPAGAITLSLESSTTNVAIGETFNINLNISGLGDQAAPSLASFLAEVIYDGNLVEFESVSYGSLLGEPTDPNETDIVTTSDVNKVSLEEISFLATAGLDALQPADFTLATLIFKASSAGSSNISFDAIDFSDADANPLLPTLDATSVNVIPIPGALFLFLSAFLTLAVSARKPGKLKSTSDF